LQFGIVIFRQKKIGEKAARKMLMKLTPCFSKSLKHEYARLEVLFSYVVTAFNVKITKFTKIAKILRHN